MSDSTPTTISEVSIEGVPRVALCDITPGKLYGWQYETAQYSRRRNRKLVVSYDPDYRDRGGFLYPGGRVVCANLYEDGSRGCDTSYAGNYFIEHAIDVSKPPHSGHPPVDVREFAERVCMVDVIRAPTLLAALIGGPPSTEGQSEESSTTERLP